MDMVNGEVANLSGTHMDEQYLVIHRIRNHLTTLELDAEVTATIPTTWLPAQAAEGHVLLAAVNAEGRSSTITFTIQDEANRQVMEHRRSTLDRLPSKNQWWFGQVRKP